MIPVYNKFPTALQFSYYVSGTLLSNGNSGDKMTLGLIIGGSIVGFFLLASIIGISIYKCKNNSQNIIKPFDDVRVKKMPYYNTGFPVNNQEGTHSQDRLNNKLSN